VLPMTTARGRLGTLGFGSKQVAHYDESEVHFLERIAELVALAIEKALTKEAITSEAKQLRALAQVSISLSERSTRAHQALQQERDKLETVLEINAALVASKLDLRQMFPAISASLGKSVPHDVAIVGLWDESGGNFQVHALAGCGKKDDVT